MTKKLTAREILEKLILEVSCCLSRTEEKAEIAKALTQLELLELGEEEITNIVENYRSEKLVDIPQGIAQAIIKARKVKWEGKE